MDPGAPQMQRNAASQVYPDRLSWTHNSQLCHSECACDLDLCVCVCQFLERILSHEWTSLQIIIVHFIYKQLIVTSRFETSELCSNVCKYTTSNRKTLFESEDLVKGNWKWLGCHSTNKLRVGLEDQGLSLVIHPLCQDLLRGGYLEHLFLQRKGRRRSCS